MSISTWRKPLSKDVEDEADEVEEENECYPPEHSVAFVQNESEVLILWDETNSDEYLLSYRQLGETWIELYTDEPEVFLDDLDPETRYEYFVVSMCDDEDSEPSSIDTFQTIEAQEDCGAPVISTAIMIEDGILVISWNEVPDAQEYELRYRPLGVDTDWSTLYSDENWIELECHFDLDYEYSLRVNCESGWTDWTDIYTYSGHSRSVENPANPGKQVDLTKLDGISFQILPNPVNGDFTLRLDANDSMAYWIHISNTSGEIIHQKRINVDDQIIHLQLSSERWTSGMYFLTVHDLNTGSSSTEKLVVLNER